MMFKFGKLATLLAIIPLINCTFVETKKAVLDQEPEGIRVYEPATYLFVDKEAKYSTIVTLLNYGRAYDLRPVSLFAKHDFAVETDGGILSKFTSNQDTTSILTFFQGAAELGAKAAGLPVKKEVIRGTFGMESGVYRLQDDGTFK